MTMKIELFALKAGEDVYVEEFVSVDNGIVTYEILDIDDMIKNHGACDKEGDGEDESDDKSPPSRKAALAALRVITQFINASDKMSFAMNCILYLNCM